MSMVSTFDLVRSVVLFIKEPHSNVGLEELSNGVSESLIVRSNLIQISILVMVFKSDIPIEL